MKITGLTATGTTQTRQAICKIPGMVNLVIIAESPNKPNINYILKRDPGTLEKKTFALLVEEIRRRTTHKSIFFVVHTIIVHELTTS